MDKPTPQHIYRLVLADPKMSSAEKAGYLHAASHVDYRMKEITIEEARQIVAEHEPHA